MKQTERARTINREKLNVDEVVAELNDPNSLRSRIFFPYLDLIKTRKKQKAFHPNAGFEILDIDPKLFAIKKYSEEQAIYALTNISSREVPVSLSGDDVDKQMTDLLTGKKFNTDSVRLTPYQYVWLSIA